MNNININHLLLLVLTTVGHNIKIHTILKELIGVHREDTQINNNQEMDMVDSSHQSLHLVGITMKRKCLISILNHHSSNLAFISNLFTHSLLHSNRCTNLLCNIKSLHNMQANTVHLWSQITLLQ